MITTNKETLWKVIRKYNAYREVDEQLAADYINQWIKVEDSRYKMEENISILNNIEKELEKVRQKEDTINTHLCSKYYFEKIDDKACAYCKESGKQATCFGMRMFCPFVDEPGGYYKASNDCKNGMKKSKNEPKQKIEMKIETYNVDENCEYYLVGQKYCLWCGAKVKCDGNRMKCESSMERRIEEICAQLGIQNGKVNGYLIKDGLVVGKA